MQQSPCFFPFVEPLYSFWSERVFGAGRTGDWPSLPFLLPLKRKQVINQKEKKGSQLKNPQGEWREGGVDGARESIKKNDGHKKKKREEKIPTAAYNAIAGVKC